jgi:hypothetical protein
MVVALSEYGMSEGVEPALKNFNHIKLSIITENISAQIGRYNIPNNVPGHRQDVYIFGG